MKCDHVCPISQMKKILLATDGSQFNEGAVREAIRFAKKCSSKLYVLSVVSEITDYEGFSPQRIEDSLRTRAGEHLDSIRSRAASEGVDCETIVAGGDEPSVQIAEAAGRLHADMIVMGRRGRSGLAKILMGQTAAKVIGHAPCKVLVVPRAAQIDFRTLLVATDGSVHGEAAVKEALGIAKCSGSVLIALTAARDEGELAQARGHVDRVIAMGNEDGVGVEGITSVGKSSQSIVEAAGGRGVDLIIMGSYGRTGLKKALMGSSTEKVIGSAGCAVLVMKA